MPVFGVEALQQDQSFGRPAWFLAFADSGAGDLWGWDLRGLRRGEYPIGLWDHDDQSAADLAVPTTTTSFDTWLDTQVHEARYTATTEKREAWWARIQAALSNHNGNVFPYAPAAEDLSAIEIRIGKILPRDYTEFTTRFGSTDWPFEIVDAQEIEALTLRMYAEHPMLRGAVAFGRDLDGTYLMFQATEIIGPRGWVARNFLAFLEARLFAVESPALPQPLVAPVKNTAIKRKR